MHILCFRMNQLVWREATCYFYILYLNYCFMHKFDTDVQFYNVGFMKWGLLYFISNRQSNPEKELFLCKTTVEDVLVTQWTLAPPWSTITTPGYQPGWMSDFSNQYFILQLRPGGEFCQSEVWLLLQLDGAVCAVVLHRPVHPVTHVPLGVRPLPGWHPHGVGEVRCHHVQWRCGRG